jgi:hypothetical protein
MIELATTPPGQHLVSFTSRQGKGRLITGRLVEWRGTNKKGVWRVIIQDEAQRYCVRADRVDRVLTRETTHHVQDE